MKKVKSLITSALLAWSMVSNTSARETKATASEDFSWDENTNEFIDSSGNNNKIVGNIFIFGLIFIIGGVILHPLSKTSLEKNEDDNIHFPVQRSPSPVQTRVNTNQANLDPSLDKKLLFRAKLNNGVTFNIYYGEICEWQNVDVSKVGSFGVLCPDNSQMRPNDGLALKICQLNGGKYNGNYWAYPDETSLWNKVKDKHGQNCENIPNGDGVLGDPINRGNYYVATYHTHGPSINLGSHLTTVQEDHLRDAYLNGILQVAKFRLPGSNDYLFEAINLCSLSDALFNVTSADSAKMLGKAIININSKNWPYKLKNINLVIHSHYDIAQNDAGNPQRTSVFIQVLKSMLVSNGIKPEDLPKN